LVSHIGLRQDIIDLFRELTISWSSQHDGYTLKTRALLMLILHRLAEILIFNIDSQAGDYRINKAVQIIQGFTGLSAVKVHFERKLTSLKRLTTLRM
jgi:hypothetical protein